MAHKVLIDKTEYSSCIVDRLEQMRRDDRHCNFIIKVGSEEIQAHRNMLCAASDYFDAMLSHDMKENRSGVVEMINVDPECVKICVDHIYGREVSVPPEKYEELMYVANLMQLQMLKDGILALLEEKLDLKSFFVTRKIACLYGYKNLEIKCVDYAEENFSSISKHQMFGELDKSYIMKMIESEKIKMTEEEKLDTLLRWVDSDSDRRKVLPGILKMIKLGEISVEKHENLIEYNPLISDNLTLYKIFTSSMVSMMRAKTTKEDADKTSENATGAALVLFDKHSGHLQRFDPSKNTLTKMQKIYAKEDRFSTVILGEHIYVLMENNSVHRLKYSEEMATWEQLADMIDFHGMWPPVAVFSRFIFVVGGRGPRSCSVEKYDPNTNKWTKMKDKPQSTRGSGILASQGFIYCFGDYGSQAKAVQRFHLDSSTWDDLPPMNEDRAFMGVTELNGKIYVMGGWKNGKELQSAEWYDFATNQWVMLKPMNIPRSHFRCFSMNRSIYAVGGDMSRVTIEKYDVENDEWEMVNLPSEKKLEILNSVIISRQNKSL